MNDNKVISKKQLFKKIRRALPPAGRVQEPKVGKGSSYNRKQKHKNVYNLENA